MNETPEKAKPTIFYAKNSDPKTSSQSDKGKRSGHFRNDKSRDNTARDRHQSNDKTPAWKAKRKVDSLADSGDRIETFKPNRPQRSKPNHEGKSENRAFDKSVRRDAYRDSDNDNYSDSPWKKSNKEKPAQEAADYDVNWQRKQEMLVYSENSCKSVFKHRRDGIIKAFITQDAAPQFKHLIEWLVSQRLGYDVVEAEQITKMTDTPHHGGICLIVKKREPISSISYLDDNHDAQQDYVLAIDDVNNPHNLGGLARTAAFYGINGLMLRQTALLESGAAMRVAEGGTESLMPIKTDDFVASLDQFKQRGYHIVALLPCQIASAQAKELHKLTLTNKTVLVIFQRINAKLIDCADEVVYIKGNDNMAALNISVATGIVLSRLFDRK